jgi:hypothetical protein
MALTDTGRIVFLEFGIDFITLKGKRRPLCLACLDWSMRRHHLAGGIGKALLHAFFDRGWGCRLPDSRIVRFTPQGERDFQNWLS